MIDQLVSRLRIRFLLAFKPVRFFDLLNRVPWYKSLLRGWIDNLDLQQGSKLLEIGCATGVLSRYISNAGVRVVGVDLSDSMIEVAESSNPDIAFHVADIVDLPFDNETFDSVVCASVLNIVSDKEAAMQEMARVCKPGGIISILVPLQGFDDEKMQALGSSLQETGFSSEALRAWHRLAPKMSMTEIQGLFKNAGLKMLKSGSHLNSMVVSVTASK